MATFSIVFLPSYSGVRRQRRRVGDDGTWRAYVTLPDRRVDRHFFDSIYGDADAAEAMARDWRDAMLALRAEPVSVGLDLDRRVAAVQADFDARRPRWIFVRVYLLEIKGKYEQVRFLVSDRGQSLRRRESAVSFGRSRTLEAALGIVKERVLHQLAVFFGPAVAAGFMADHRVVFSLTGFDPETGITLRLQLDQYRSVCEPQELVTTVPF